jgi:hypothetical protein
MLTRIIERCSRQSYRHHSLRLMVVELLSLSSPYIFPPAFPFKPTTTPLFRSCPRIVFTEHLNPNHAHLNIMQRKQFLCPLPPCIHCPMPQSKRARIRSRECQWNCYTRKACLNGHTAFVFKGYTS